MDVDISEEVSQFSELKTLTEDVGRNERVVSSVFYKAAEWRKTDQWREGWVKRRGSQTRNGVTRTPNWRRWSKRRTTWWTWSPKCTWSSPYSSSHDCETWRQRRTALCSNWEAAQSWQKYVAQAELTTSLSIPNQAWKEEARTSGSSPQCWEEESWLWSSSKIMLKRSMDNGLLTKQLVNKAILMMKDRVFGHGTTTSMLGSPESFRIAKSKEEKAKEKTKAKVDSKELVMHFLVKKKKTRYWMVEKKMVFGGPLVKEARKFLRKVNNYLSENDVRTYRPEKVTGNEYSPYKGRGKDQKRKSKEGAYPQSELSASETPSEEGHGHSWESDDWYSSFTDDSANLAIRGATAWYGAKHTAWMASVHQNLANHPTHVVLGLGCTRSVGSRAAVRRFQKHALYYGITTEFCRCNTSFVFANSETESCWENCIIHFPTTPPCSTGVDVLETGNVPISFSLPQMKNMGRTIELNPKGYKITCLAFGLYSSPAEYLLWDILFWTSRVLRASQNRVSGPLTQGDMVLFQSFTFFYWSLSDS